MRIAIISDIHGNYPALVKVVEDAVSNGVDKFIFAGDYIFDLPFSNEVTRLLMKLKKSGNAYIIKGNKEGYLSNLANDNQENWIYDQMGIIYQTFRELEPDVFDFLNCLDEECNITLSSGVSIHVVHSPSFFNALRTGLFKTLAISSSSVFHKRMCEEPFTHEQFLSEFTDIVNSGECKSIINQIDANVIIFGHNHLQKYAYCGDKLIINPGSCGQPLDCNTAAAYTIIEETSGGFNVFEKRVAYDIEAMISQAKEAMTYQKGRIWSELVFLSLRTAKDHSRIFFDIAEQITVSKNKSNSNYIRERGSLFDNDTWNEAYEVFISRYKENRGHFYG